MAYYENTRPEVAAMIDFAPRRALEIGCGAGAFRANLPAQCEVWGVEPVAAVAAQAAQRLQRVLVGQLDDVQRELPDRHFDLIVCNDVIEHIADTDRALAIVRAKLAAGGRVVGSVPNVRYVGNLWELLVQRDWRYRDEGVLDRTHLRFFTRRSLLRTLAEAGFAVEAVRGLNSVWLRNHTPVRKGIALALAALLGRDSFYLQFGFRVRAD